MAHRNPELEAVHAATLDGMAQLDQLFYGDGAATAAVQAGVMRLIENLLILSRPDEPRPPVRRRQAQGGPVMTGYEVELRG